MTTRHQHGRLRSHDAGISLVELLVGVLIGLIATAVIYQTFAVSEAFKRNATGAGDAQQNGLLSTFMLAQDISNAGNALASAAFALDACPKDLGTTDPADWMKVTARPLPIMIVAGASADDPDQFIVNYAVPRTIVYPAPFATTAEAGATQYDVQSPLGFRAGDMVVAIGGGNCDRTVVTSVSGPDGNGVVNVTVRDPSPHTFEGGTAKASLFNLGTAPDAAAAGEPHVQRVQYAVCFPKGSTCVPRSETSEGDRARINGALRSKDLLDGGTFQPIASNIVNMKLQYGVDDVGDGLLHSWVGADKAPWRYEDLMNADWKTISRIKAVRIGLVVASSQYDQKIKSDFEWVLFDGQLRRTIAHDTGGGGFRYRVYETVVPLRNSLWNRQL